MDSGNPITPMFVQTPSGLARKLAEVMAAVERIPKNGWNDFHKYHYATEADTVEAIRGELAQRQIVLLPAITAMHRDGVGDKGQVLTTLEMEFTFIDGESGELETRPWLGSGTDKEDKGAYKAMTGGQKTFLLKAFLVPTGDDPEQEGKTQAPPRQAAQPSGSTVLTRKQTAPAAAQPAASGALYVTKVKTAKTGRSSKGPWTLYIVTLSNDQELKTFDDAVAKSAEAAREDHAPVTVLWTAVDGLKEITSVA
jgi:hypothetical protein